MKANQAVSYVIDQDNQIITFTVKGYDPFTLDVAKIHDDNAQYAMFAGLAQQRMVDGAAVSRANKDGSVKTEAEMLGLKHTRMLAIRDHLESGSPNWEMRVSRQPAETDHSLTLRAMEQVLRRDRAGVEAAIKAWVDNGHGSRVTILDSFAARSDVADAIREYRKERSANVDTDSLLADLESGE